MVKHVVLAASTLILLTLGSPTTAAVHDTDDRYATLVSPTGETYYLYANARSGYDVLYWYEVTLYEETNGLEGLQRGDTCADGSHARSGEPCDDGSDPRRADRIVHRESETAYV